MPLPLLAFIVGGLGLSAAESAFAGKRRGKRKAARMSLFDETLGNADRLDAGQRKLIRGVFSLDQQEGIDLLDQTLQRNLSREQLKQAADFQVENVRDRLTAQTLRQKEYDNKVRELDQATDPRITATTLAKQGLQVFGTPAEIRAGDFEVAPIHGTTEWGEGVASFRSVADALENANVMVESIATFGAVVDLSNPQSQVQALAYQRMIAGMKVVLETGALAEFEAAMVGRAIQDPGSVFNAMMGGGDGKALLSAGMFRDLIAKSGARQIRDKRNFQLDQADVDFMGRQIERSTQRRPVPSITGRVTDPNTVPIVQQQSGMDQFFSEMEQRLEIIRGNKTGDVRRSADAMNRLRMLQRQGAEMGGVPVSGVTGAAIQGQGQAIFDLFQ